jgi:serine protease AprX
MKKIRNFPIGPIVLWLLISFCFFLSACSQDTITATAVTSIDQDDTLADVLSSGLSDTEKPSVEEKIIEPEEITQIALEEPKPKIEPAIKEIIESTPKEKVEVILTVKDEDDIKKISKLIEDSSGNVKGEFKVGDVISAEIEAEKLEALSEEEGVEEISLEKEYIAFLDESIPQIHIDTVAWANNYTGTGVKIAILDTGIDTDHEMFGNRVILSQSFNAEGVNDLNGHGTHCAGIAAGNGQYKGAAPDAYLLNAKVLNTRGSGTTSNIIAGINWAVDPDGNESTDDGADIISMSFGGALTDLDGPLARAIRQAINKGVIFVVASGNCRQGCGGFFGVTMPGSMSEVITVGAVDSNNNVASFSSGDTFSGYIKPDVVAPGVNIMSSALDDDYRELSGTSMSTPMIAGLIANMLEKESLTHAQIKTKLESTATDLGNSGKDTSYGSGLVNVSGLFGVANTQTNNTANNTTEQTNETYDGYWVTVEINPDEREEPVCPENYSGYDPGLGLTKKEFYFLFEDCEIQKDSGLLVEKSKAGDQNFTASDYEIPSHIRIKLRNDSKLYVPNRTDNEPRFDRESLLAKVDISSYTPPKQPEPSNDTNLTKQALDIEIEYDDDYTHESSSSDAVTWGGEDISVNIDGSYWTGYEVVCYDWCGDGTYDHCFADRSSDFDACEQESSYLRSYCNDNKCHTGTDVEDTHDIDPGDAGDRWRCNIKVKYYGHCQSSIYSYGYDSAQRKYYVVSPRQYICEDSNSYDDFAYYSSSWGVVFDTISCDSDEACDYSRDESSASFGTYGTSTPNDPCRLDDGESDCDSDSDCLTGSHCSEVTGYDYCCPSGKEWINSACRTCDTCSSSGSKKRTGDTVYECKDYGSFNCWNAISSLGDGDFCDDLTSFSRTCGHGEYDCDSNSECGSNLVCTGSWSCWGGDCGCCYSNEEWDQSSHQCKKKDGQSCSSGGQCHGGYCVHGICRSSSTHCGDTYCDSGENYDSCDDDCDPQLGHKDYCDWKGTCSHHEYDCDSNSECGTNLECKRPPGTGYGDTNPNTDYDGCCYSGETWDISEKKCKATNGQSCSSDSSCYSGYCVHGTCRPTDPYCGDDYCDSGENYDSCSWDCDPQLGHADYCDWKGNCAHGEYDCDSNDECASGLVCVGSFWTGDKGCCNSNEDWDTSSHKCKAKNGESCTQDGQCYSGHCVHNVCRPTDPYYGDGYCDTDKWETCSNSPQDCKKCDLAHCITGVECQGGHCVHNKCWHSSYIKNDGFCDTGVGESQGNSPNDCYGQLTVMDVTQWPSSVNQGQSFQVKARLENKGTIPQTLDLEAGIPPNSWYSYVISTNASQNFTTQAYWGITQCCPGNKYYDAVRITLNPGQSQIVTFNLVAPTIHDKDACDTNTPKKSAWDNQHTLVVGLYSSCGQAYTHYKAKPIHVNDRFCYSDNACWQNEVCDFNDGVPGVCAVAVCENECDTDGAYFCVSSEIRQCEDVDNDGCLESKNIDYCIGEYECIDGQSACVKKSKKKIRVDYSSGYTTVNKQPGDILRLMADYSGSLNLAYSSSAFEFVECKSGTISTQECVFNVKDRPGTYNIGLSSGPKATVKIIRNPKLIIVTDRAELIQRFGDDDEVDSMLMQAYVTAAEKDGCIYDLPDYITRDD